MTGPSSPSQPQTLGVGESRKLFAFRQPAGPAGSYTSMRAQVLPVPASISSLRAVAAVFFPPPRFYDIVLAYSVETYAQGVRTEREIMLMDDIEVQPFNAALNAGMLPNPVIVNVHHVRYSKQTGEIAAEKIGKEVHDPLRLGAHLKLDGVKQSTHFSTKKENLDAALAEYEGGGSPTKSGKENDEPQWYGPSASSSSQQRPPAAIPARAAPPKSAAPSAPSARIHAPTISSALGGPSSSSSGTAVPRQSAPPQMNRASTQLYTHALASHATTHYATVPRSSGVATSSQTAASNPGPGASGPSWPSTGVPSSG